MTRPQPVTMPMVTLFALVPFYLVIGELVQGGPMHVPELAYESDIRYNCFPSLHVAQCFIAALVCHRVHRGVGAVAGAWAGLVALSTLFTKQHYVLDVVGGVALAGVAWLFFVRGCPPDAVPERERRLAPALAVDEEDLEEALRAAEAQGRREGRRRERAVGEASRGGEGPLGPGARP